jgi:Tripartite tricarboxylate transporter TctB family
MSRPGVVLLLAIIALAMAALLATPQLIAPFPSQAPWFESAASFPRMALLIVGFAGVVEIFLRLRSATSKASGSDELDSSSANIKLAASALALFCLYAFAVPVLGFLVSTFAFLIACGLLLRLPLTHIFLLATPLSLTLWFVFVKILKVSFGHGWLI